MFWLSMCAAAIGAPVLGDVSGRPPVFTECVGMGVGEMGLDQQLW